MIDGGTVIGSGALSDAELRDRLRPLFDVTALEHAYEQARGRLSAAASSELAAVGVALLEAGVPSVDIACLARATESAVRAFDEAHVLESIRWTITDESSAPSNGGRKRFLHRHTVRVTVAEPDEVVARLQLLLLPIAALLAFAHTLEESRREARTLEAKIRQLEAYATAQEVQLDQVHRARSNNAIESSAAVDLERRTLLIKNARAKCAAKRGRLEALLTEIRSQFQSFLTAERGALHADDASSTAMIDDLARAMRCALEDERCGVYVLHDRDGEERARTRGQRRSQMLSRVITISVVGVLAAGVAYVGLTAAGARDAKHERAGASQAPLLSQPPRADLSAYKVMLLSDPFLARNLPKNILKTIAEGETFETVQQAYNSGFARVITSLEASADLDNVLGGASARVTYEVIDSDRIRASMVPAAAAAISRAYGAVAPAVSLMRGRPGSSAPETRALPAVFTRDESCRDDVVLYLSVRVVPPAGLFEPLASFQIETALVAERGTLNKICGTTGFR